ncbi:NAD(P)H-dependent oxidoreductase subunit E [[Eubacterium] cellulosolvens]
MKELNRIGVFLCWCGANIARSVNVKKVIEEIRNYPGVAHAEDYIYMCSDPGQELIKQRIKEYNLDGLIIANCSPTLHEKTFRNLAESMGLNRFRCEIANVREQCSWPHEHEIELATKKAIKIIKSMIDKIKLNAELKPLKIPLTKKALVIGGGVTGIQAALDIADGGYDVYLLERDPSIGGHMLQLSETFPTLDCPQCIMTPKMTEANQHDNIQILSYSELEEVTGYLGNFKVKIRKKARSIKEEICTGCGECVNNCLVSNEIQIPEFKSIQGELEPKMQKELDEIINKYAGEVGVLIPILQDINQLYNYLPELALKYISERLEVPLGQVYHVATFYTAFSLKPRGKHIIKVCLGTACHVRGSNNVLDELKRVLKIEPGETTADQEYSLETVNCLGACALGPVVVKDDKYFGQMSSNKVKKILKTEN